jgi:PAS domain S-box-containing protein
MTALRFLLLEDSLLDAEVIQVTLIDGGIDCDVQRLDTRADFVAALETDEFDLILADYTLPSFDGISALEIARNLRPDTPFIIVSASLGEELAIDTLKQGATDYVLKQRLERLVPAVNRALREAQERLERKRAEAALRQSEAQYRTLFESIDEGFCICEMLFDKNNQPVDYRFLQVNPAFEQLTGLQQATGKTARELVPNLEPFWVEVYGRVVQTGKPMRFEHQSIAMSGRWFDVNAFPIGEPQSHQFAILFTNISERKQAEDALRQSKARFRLMVESAKEYAIFTLDLNGTITSWNSGAQRLLGYQETEIIGCNSRVIFTPEDAERGEAEREMQTALTQGRAENERWHMRKDGSRFWGSGIVMPLQNEVGNTQGLVKIMQDKTQSRQAAEREQFLAQSSAALAASIDYKTTLTTIARLAVPFLADYCFFDVVNANGQIDRVAWYAADPAMQGWFDGVQQFIPPQDFDSHPVAHVLQSGNAHFIPEATQEWMQSAATSPAHLQFMQQCQLRSLITVPLKIAHQPLGALTFCFTTHSDRHYTQTDLTLAEELARRAALALDNAKLYHQAQEANRIKDEFLAVLSHELRSPLNPILGWVRLLQNGKLDVPRQAEALATIERNARLQTQLIEDLLDISRIMQGKLTLTAAPVSLTSVISAAMETVRLAAEAKQIQILLDLDTGVAPVSGDAARLQQVVWNLLTNAVKFTSNGGQVKVELRQLHQLAQIRVIDTGQGIDPKFLPHVFEYFRQADSTTTRKFGGLGLGLAIVRQIVEMHGGTVKAESLGDNQGATFTVQLPLLGSRESAVGSRETPTHSPRRTPHSPLADLDILVVDDDDDTRELQAFLLEQRGARVTAVASGLEALQALDQFIPDVIVSDIGMADMDGYMLMQQIRSRSPSQGGQVPAIALTAYARDFDQQKARQAGFQTHITKPVEPEALVEAIAILLR